MFWSLFRVFKGSGVFWRYMVILRYFGAKSRRNSQLPIEPVQSRHLKSTVDRPTTLVVDRQGSAQCPTWFLTDLWSKFHIIYKIIPGRLQPNIYVLFHYFGQHTLSYFLLYSANHIQDFQQFGENIHDFFRNLYWNSSFSTLFYLCNLFRYLLCSALLCLSSYICQISG